MIFKRNDELKNEINYLNKEIDDLLAKNENLSYLKESFEDIIREELEIPTDMRIVLTIALGYPDQDAEVNKFRSSRENLSEFITWIGY